MEILSSAIPFPPHKPEIQVKNSSSGQWETLTIFK